MLAFSRVPSLLCRSPLARTPQWSRVNPSRKSLLFPRSTVPLSQFAQYSSWRPPQIKFVTSSNDRKSRKKESKPRRSLLRSRIGWIYVGIISVSGIVTILTHLEKAPYSNRTRFVTINPEEEEIMGIHAMNALLEDEKLNFLPYDPKNPLWQLVEGVSNDVIQAADREDLSWELVIVDSEEKNAFVLPGTTRTSCTLSGGKIFVFAGILPITENEDGLAFILAHEVAHVIARHSAERMSLAKMVVLFRQLVLVWIVPDAMPFDFTSMLLNLAYSRKMESEADFIAIQLMKKTKYDINEAPKLWERMEKSEGIEGMVPAFLSTHPSSGNRSKQIRKWIEEEKNL